MTISALLSVEDGRWVRLRARDAGCGTRSAICAGRGHLQVVFNRASCMNASTVVYVRERATWSRAIDERYCDITMTVVARQGKTDLLQVDREALNWEQ